LYQDGDQSKVLQGCQILEHVPAKARILPEEIQKKEHLEDMGRFRKRRLKPTFDMQHNSWV
jgi:hypothetical protein